MPDLESTACEFLCNIAITGYSAEIQRISQSYRMFLYNDEGCSTMFE